MMMVFHEDDGREKEDAPVSEEALEEVMDEDDDEETPLDTGFSEEEGKDWA